MDPVCTHRPARRAAALALLLTLALLVGASRAEAVLLEGALRDPAARAEGHNPTLGSKLVGYTALRDRQRRAPDVLILGSSRAVQLDPRQVRQLSGRSAYNAAISDAAAREYLALSSFAELLTPGRAPHLVVMFDLEALDRRLATRRVLSVIEAGDRARAACRDADRCGPRWQRAARRIVRDARLGVRVVPPAASTQRPDGMQVNGALERQEAAGVDLDRLRRGGSPSDPRRTGRAAASTASCHGRWRRPSG